MRIATSSVHAPIMGSVPVQLNFPNVTKFITVKNRETSLRVGFSALGVTGSNYFVVNGNETYTADLRVAQLFFLGNVSGLTCSFSVVAGLTGIEAGLLVGNWSGSAGVG